MTAEDLKKARLAVCLTQAQLAAILGLHVYTIRNYEKGGADVPQAVAVAMAYMVRYGLFEGIEEAHIPWRLAS